MYFMKWCVSISFTWASSQTELDRVDRSVGQSVLPKEKKERKISIQCVCERERNGEGYTKVREGMYVCVIEIDSLIVGNFKAECTTERQEIQRWCSIESCHASSIMCFTEVLLLLTEGRSWDLTPNCWSEFSLLVKVVSALV